MSGAFDHDSVLVRLYWASDFLMNFLMNQNMHRKEYTDKSVQTEVHRQNTANNIATYNTFLERLYI